MSPPGIISEAEWNCLAACRALSECGEDKTIILLDGICDGVSEAQENKIFAFLRDVMQKDPRKVVLVTASRFATARHSDRVIVLAHGQVVDDDTFERIAAKAATASMTTNIFVSRSKTS